MRPDKDLMLLERIALDSRLAGLDYYLSSEAVTKLDQIDRDLLHRQYKAMCYYQSILHQRIDRIK